MTSVSKMCEVTVDTALLTSSASHLLGPRVENKEWFVKNAQLKEAGGGSGVKRQREFDWLDWIA